MGLPGIGDGALLGYSTISAVCRRCSYRGSPLVFDDPQALGDFHKALAQGEDPAGVRGAEDPDEDEGAHQEDEDEGAGQEDQDDGDASAVSHAGQRRRHMQETPPGPLGAGPTPRPKAHAAASEDPGIDLMEDLSSSTGAPVLGAAVGLAGAVLALAGVVLTVRALLALPVRIASGTLDSTVFLSLAYPLITLGIGTAAALIGWRMTGWGHPQPATGPQPPGTGRIDEVAGTGRDRSAAIGLTVVMGGTFLIGAILVAGIALDLGAPGPVAALAVFVFLVLAVWAYLRIIRRLWMR